MKKVFYLTVATLAATLAVSCNKPVQGPEAEPVLNETYGNLRVSFSVSEKNATKALTAGADETKINSVHVFVFNKDTKKRETDRFETITADTHTNYTMTLTSLTGNKIVWAVINSPRITDVPNEDALKAKVSDLGENTITNLLMSGYNDNVVVEETNANVDGKENVVSDAAIKVYRLGARISLENVTVDFSKTDLEGATFTLTGLYLKNVVGKVRIDGASSGAGIDQPTGWYNLGNQANVEAAPDAIKGLTRDKPLTHNCVSNGAETALGYSWYVYPNGTPTDNNSAAGGAGFSIPRKTRLVIQAHLSGNAVSGTLNEDTYYVFTIPEIVRNHAYNIHSLKITMRGKPKDEDDTPTTSGQLAATVTVQDWATQETLTFNI